MKARPAIRIAANDPTLAHALMRTATEQEGEAAMRRLKFHLPPAPSMNVSRLSTAINRAFGPLLVSEYIGRRHGDRAHGQWLALTHTRSDDLMPLFLCWKKGHLDRALMPYRFTSHAIARLAQRTIGAADMTRAAPVLVRHLLVIFPALWAIEKGREDKGESPLTRFRTNTNEGAFLWKHEAGYWIAGTWIDPQSAADPIIRADCAEVKPGEGKLRTLD